MKEFDLMVITLKLMRKQQRHGTIELMNGVATVEIAGIL